MQVIDQKNASHRQKTIRFVHFTHNFIFFLRFYAIYGGFYYIYIYLIKNLDIST